MDWQNSSSEERKRRVECWIYSINKYEYESIALVSLQYETDIFNRESHKWVISQVSKCMLDSDKCSNSEVYLLSVVWVRGKCKEKYLSLQCLLAQQLPLENSFLHTAHNYYLVWNSFYYYYFMNGLYLCGPECQSVNVFH